MCNYCSKCGFGLRENAKFCEGCGKKIVTEKELREEIMKRLELEFKQKSDSGEKSMSSKDNKDKK